MKRSVIFLLTLGLIGCLSSCQKIANSQLERQMKSAAKKHLEADHISGYKDLKIDCVDTVTEFAYAALTTELLTNMAAFYEQDYEQAALSDNDSKANAIELELNEINRIIDQLNDMMINGDFKSKGVFKYMVTGNYQKDGKTNEFMFLVDTDKKTLHTIDPFTNNVLFDE